MTPSSFGADADGTFRGQLVEVSESTSRPQCYPRRRRRRQQRHMGPSVGSGSVHDMLHFVALISTVCIVSMSSSSTTTTALAYTNSPLFTSMSSKSPYHVNSYQLRHSLAILTRSKAGKDDEDKSVMKKNDENKSKQQMLKKNNREIEDDDDDDGEDEEESGWLTWMVSGRKRGSAEIKMRDPEELGGVPRSERYSSKYVFYMTRVLMDHRSYLV